LFKEPMSIIPEEDIKLYVLRSANGEYVYRTTFGVYQTYIKFFKFFLNSSIKPV